MKKSTMQKSFIVAFLFGIIFSIAPVDAKAQVSYGWWTNPTWWDSWSPTTDSSEDYLSIFYNKITNVGYSSVDVEYQFDRAPVLSWRPDIFYWPVTVYAVLYGSNYNGNLNINDFLTNKQAVLSEVKNSLTRSYKLGVHNTRSSFKTFKLDGLFCATGYDVAFVAYAPNAVAPGLKWTVMRFPDFSNQYNSSAYKVQTGRCSPPKSVFHNLSVKSINQFTGITEVSLTGRAVVSSQKHVSLFTYIAPNTTDLYKSYIPIEIDNGQKIPLKNGGIWQGLQGTVSASWDSKTDVIDTEVIVPLSCDKKYYTKFAVDSVGPSLPNGPRGALPDNTNLVSSPVVDFMVPCDGSGIISSTDNSYGATSATAPNLDDLPDTIVVPPGSNIGVTTSGKDPVIIGSLGKNISIGHANDSTCTLDISNGEPVPGRTQNNACIVNSNSGPLINRIAEYFRIQFANNQER